MTAKDKIEIVGKWFLVSSFINSRIYSMAESLKPGATTDDLLDCMLELQKLQSMISIYSKYINSLQITEKDA